MVLMGDSCLVAARGGKMRHFDRVEPWARH
jgi:hypothetical protein